MTQASFNVPFLFLIVLGSGFILNYKFRHLDKFGGMSMVVMLAGIMIANTGLAPSQSSLHLTLVNNIFTPTAIILFVLASDLTHIKRVNRKLILTFLVAVVSTIIGVVTTFCLFYHTFPKTMWQFAGVFSATYTGGTINLITVANEIGFSGSNFTTSIAVDNVVTMIWLIACILLPNKSADNRKYDTSSSTINMQVTKELQEKLIIFGRLKWIDVTILITISLTILFFSNYFARQWDIPAPIIFITLSLLVSSGKYIKDLKGSAQLGLICIQPFLFASGMETDISQILDSGIQIFWIAATIVIIHGVILFLYCFLTKASMAEYVVTSQCAIGGIPTALMLVNSKKWNHLILPSIVLCSIGTFIGTYIGLLLSYLLQQTI